MGIDLPGSNRNGVPPSLMAARIRSTLFVHANPVGSPRVDHIVVALALVRSCAQRFFLACNTPRWMPLRTVSLFTPTFFAASP